MEHYGILSLLPAVGAIVLAIKTRQVFVSLFLGIWLGWMILNDWHPLYGTLASIQALVDVFKEAGNTRTIMFSALVGALIAFIQRSGGVKGFVAAISNRLKQQGSKADKRKIQLFAWLTGFVIFVESSINVLTVGAIYRPLFDRLKIPREKLAYLADSISAPTCILIPLNAWGAYIMGLLIALGIDDPLSVLIAAYPLNFYPFLAMFLLLGIIITQKDYGAMKKAEKRARDTGKVLADGARPMLSDEIVSMEPKADVPARSLNMIVPIAVMVFMMPLGLLYSGWPEHGLEAGIAATLLEALGNGSGSSAVLWAVTTALLVAAIMYRVQKIFNLKELVDLTIKGISGLIPLALLMMLAFAIGAVSKKLGAGQYAAEIAQLWVNPAFVPVIIFSISCFIAFSTGTSWGTFAIMTAIAVPMAQSMDVSLPLAIAAVLGGGVFGDHCSPISDTTIISSMASASDHIDHVKTQLPYAVTAGSIAFVFYIVAGIVMHG